MASDWDEAAARKRLADYDAAFSQEGVTQDNYPEWQHAVSVARENVDFWSVEDLTHAYAEIDRLRAKNLRLRLRVEKLEAEIFAIS